MSKHYTRSGLIRMMAGPDVVTTEHHERAAAFVGAFANARIGATLFEALDPTPWSEIDREAYQARVREDRERNARVMRKLAEREDELPLALYLGEAIAHVLEHGNDLLGAVAAWRISWESGMPDKRLRRFYVNVALAVPGQRAERDGKLFFHLDVDADVVGAGLQFPWLPEDPAPRMSNALPCRALSAELAGGLFNIVVELQREHEIDMWERVREDIAGELTPEWLVYDREHYPDMEPYPAAPALEPRPGSPEA